MKYKVVMTELATVCPTNTEIAEFDSCIDASIYAAEMNRECDGYFYFVK